MYLVTDGPEKVRREINCETDGGKNGGCEKKKEGKDGVLWGKHKTAGRKLRRRETCFYFSVGDINKEVNTALSHHCGVKGVRWCFNGIKWLKPH